MSADISKTTKGWWLAALVTSLILQTASTASAEDWTYTVRPGDNLWSIAEQHLVRVGLWPKLQARNQVADPSHIPPGTQIRIPVGWLRNSPFLARVASVHGPAEVLEDGAGPGKPLASSNWLLMGDVVTTGPDANVTLEFVDGSRVLLQADSRMIMDNIGIYGTTGMADTRLRLQQGRLETQVEPREGPATRFEIATPTAVTSVRGTNYRVEAELTHATSRAEVLGGKVRVNSAGRGRLLSAGYGVVAEAGKPPGEPVKLLDPPDLSGLPDELDRVPIQLQLSPVPGARGYRLQIARTADFEPLLADQRYTTEQLRGPDLPDGNYRFRIRAIDEQGLEGTNAERSFELNARPEAPFLLEPKPGAGVAETNPGFAWSGSEITKHYHFQVARNQKFTEVIADLPRLNENRFTVEVELHLGRYYWRVASVADDEGRGPFSDPQEFRRVPPAPEAEEPQIEGDTMDIRWRSGLPGQQYQFQMAESAEFTKPLIDTRTAEPKLQIPRPDAGTYYLRIRTIDADGFEGPYGKPQTIEVPHSRYWWLMVLPLFALFAI